MPLKGLFRDKGKRKWKLPFGDRGYGLGFRVRGLGFRGLGFRVWGVGLGLIEGIGFGVEGSGGGCRGLGLGFGVKVWGFSF